MIYINGKEISKSSVSLCEYLSENNYNSDGIAIELNYEILPKAKYADTVLRDGDTVEIVSFVGGG